MPWIALPLVLSRLKLTHCHIQVTSSFGNIPCQSTSSGINVQFRSFIVRPKCKSSDNAIFCRWNSLSAQTSELFRSVKCSRRRQMPQSSIFQLIDPFNRHRQHLSLGLIANYFCKLRSRSSIFGFESQQSAVRVPSSSSIIIETFNALLLIPDLSRPNRNFT